MQLKQEYGLVAFSVKDFYDRYDHRIPNQRQSTIKTNQKARLAGRQVYDDKLNRHDQVWYLSHFIRIVETG